MKNKHISTKMLTGNEKPFLDTRTQRKQQQQQPHNLSYLFTKKRGKRKYVLIESIMMRTIIFAFFFIFTINDFHENPCLVLGLEGASELSKSGSFEQQDQLEDVVVVAGSTELNDVIEQQQQAAAAVTSITPNNNDNSQRKQQDLATSQQQHHSTIIKQPTFGEPDTESNFKRVVVGRPVRLKCVVNDIGNHTVSWFHKDKRVLLAIDDKVINWRDRVQVSSQADSVFFLQFEHVQLSDKVSFLCYYYLI